MEATGGLRFWRPSTAGLPAVVMNPRQVHFAKALGTLAKTDALDARILAAYPAGGPAHERRHHPGLTALVRRAVACHRLDYQRHMPEKRLQTILLPN